MALAFSPQRQKPLTSAWYEFTWLFFGISLLYAIGLSIPPLSVPDGARYSEIPREMIELNDYITPHLNYIKYFEKPILFYWMQCAAIKLFGFNTWALRLPTLLMSVLGSMVTFFLAYQLYDRRTAWLACLILTTSALYYGMAHFITLDMTVSTWLTTCLASFLLAMQAPTNSPSRKWYCMIMYGTSALAVLTKGLIGILLPGLIFFIWILLYNRWQDLLKFYIPAGLLLFLLITLPWHLLVQMRHHEFFHFYFLEQQFHRYLTYSAGRFKGAWFFIPVLILGFAPWFGFLIPAYIKTWVTSTRQFHHCANEIFLLVWATVLFLFFSFSKSQLVPYILPIFPALAIITANYLASHWSCATKPWAWHFAVFVTLCASLTTAALLAVLPHYFALSDPILGQFYLKMLLAILALGVSISLILWLTSQHQSLIFSFAIASAVFLITAFYHLQFLRDFSIKPIADWLKPKLTAHDVVASYKTYYQDLPVYLQRRIVIVDWQNELDFGAAHQPDGQQWLINSAQFKHRWMSKQRIFAVMEKYEYHALLKQKWPMFLLYEANQQALVVNHKPHPQLEHKITHQKKI